MKKALLFFIFAAGVNSSVFLFSDESLLSESWFALGFEYGNLFEGYSEQGNKVETYTGSLGITWGGYRFFNEQNIGMFAHSVFSFPIVVSEKTNGVITRSDFSNYTFNFHVGMVLGLGFRYDINERLKLRYAVGLDFLMISSIYTGYIPDYGDVKYGVAIYNLGIGGDVGIKFDINKTVFLTVGSLFTFDFARLKYMNTSFSGRSLGWVDKFYLFGIRPYIAVGLNIIWR